MNQRNMSLSKKLKLLCQSQSNNCQDPDDVLKNNKAVVSSSSPNFHAFLNQQSFMLPFSGVKNSDIVRRVKSTSVPDVIKSCARSPPATNDNNTNNAVDGEYLLSYECSGESFSGSPFKDISSLRAPPAASRPLPLVRRFAACRAAWPRAASVCGHVANCDAPLCGQPQ